MRQLDLNACDSAVTVQCESDETARVVSRAFDGLTARGSATSVARRFVIEGQPLTERYRIIDVEGDVASCTDASSLLYCLDRQLTIALQLLRPDIFFVHGAAVALDGRVAVLAGPSGSGKSTLTLALTHDGFQYLSDELAPVDLSSLTIYPYPRALCLKSPPPEPYQLPAGTVRAVGRYYVPVDALDAGFQKQTMPVGALVFVQRANGRTPPARPVSRAEAVAHLVSNCLNGAAHHSGGLDAAARITETVPCFMLDSTRLEEAPRAVRRILDKAWTAGSSRAKVRPASNHRFDGG
jgi:hypothetical protein